MANNQPNTFSEFMADENSVSPANRKRNEREVAKIGKKIEAKEDQARFWTPEWQAAERAADEDIKNARVSGPFDNAKDLIANLHKYTYEHQAVINLTAERYIEADGSITLSLNEIDIIENGATEWVARHQLGKAILDYANDYYAEFDLWTNAPNRKAHAPYVEKALTINDAEKIGNMIVIKRK